MYRGLGKERGWADLKGNRRAGAGVGSHFPSLLTPPFHFLVFDHVVYSVDMVLLIGYKPSLKTLVDMHIFQKRSEWYGNSHLNYIYGDGII